MFATILKAVLSAVMFLMKDDDVREYAVGKVKKLVSDKRQKSQTINAIINEVEDDDLHQVIVHGANYLAGKTSNTYDDKLVMLLDSQAVSK